MNASSEALDWTSLRQLSDLLGPEGLDDLDDLVETFLGDFPQQLHALRESLATSNTVRLKGVAHTAKGSSATMGALGLSALCLEVEGLCDSGDMASLEGTFDRLDGELERVRQELLLWRERIVVRPDGHS
jgi:HPt (histidine-containing phosphotransfer) domain-containing protein